MTDPHDPVVVIDGMGHDDGAAPVVAAALAAAASGTAIALILDDPIAADVRRTAASAGYHMDVIRCCGVVGMEDEPAQTVGSRPDASIRVAAAHTARLLAAGRSAALLSAGPTGATLAAAVLELGRADGVRRPVLAARLPRLTRVDGEVATPDRAPVILVDAGAQPDLDAAGLVIAALLGRRYAIDQGIEAPTIGLLGVGSEPGKTNVVGREAEPSLRELDGFVGTVEPRGVLGGQVDVVVCDGFTGNVMLKTVEALAPAGITRDSAAVLLGVAGRVLVAHGAADPSSLSTAIRAAAALARASRHELDMSGRIIT